MIGAQRAGTTWLWDRLRQHPEIWMAPVKELHYFDRERRYPSPSRLSEASILRRVLGASTDARALRRTWWRRLRSYPSRSGLSEMRWDLRYFLGHVDDRWYRSLFPTRGDLLCGEVTPAYSILDEADIRNVLHVSPDVKIIFIMRDPIDRAWSHARLAFRSELFRGRVSTPALLSFLHSPAQLRRGDYPKILRSWELHVAPENLALRFYDDLQQDPGAFLEDLHRFLGVSSYRSPDWVSSTRVNAGPRADLPDSIRTELERLYAPTLRWLADRFGGAPRRWQSKLGRGGRATLRSFQ